MAEIKITRNCFLWCMSAIYLFSFSSLYYQIPGLYGDNGILPVRAVLQQRGRSLDQAFSENPTVLWYMSALGLRPEESMDLLCLVGALMAFLAMVSAVFRDTVTFAVLWALYLSLYQVGQTFLWFQWDILLLEAGFLSILVAPLNLWKWQGPDHHQHDPLNLWLLRWLLFRLMFASGVVKLTSGCPTWWGLTALNYHFESQCIPTAAAWYFHQLPEWWQKLSVVATYVIEIFIPFMFFLPVRSIRIFAFYSQVFFQLMIILTGNYNFFNLLTIALCISLLDDDYFTGKKGNSRESKLILRLGQLLSFVIKAAAYGGLAYWTVKLFSLKLDLKREVIDSNIAFDYPEFAAALEAAMPITIWMGAVSLSLEILKALYRCIKQEKGLLSKLWSLLGSLFFASTVVYMFSISLVPHSLVDKTAYQNIWPVVRNWHQQMDHLELTSSYGLFRRMTGVGGRPEVIIQGSNDGQSGWKEYEFLYKPGNVSRAPSFVAPHQPRLDWQLWFAALGNFQENPWFLSLVFRLLDNQEEVLNLIEKNPFGEKPPKYIRAQLYHYHFTTHRKPATINWWKREMFSEYMPILSKDNQSLVKYLKEQNILEEKEAKHRRKTAEISSLAQFLRKTVTVIRNQFKNISGPFLVNSLFLSGLFVNIFSFLSAKQNIKKN